jgi:hypothetical protein
MFSLKKVQKVTSQFPLRSLLFPNTHSSSLSLSWKSFTKTIQRASDFLSTVGPSPIKSLRSAILSNDEDKAIIIYQSDTSGHPSLEDILLVSHPFPLKAYEDQSPMHLAALKGMENLIILFLKRNGNPMDLNSNAETCLHSLCQESNHDLKRQQILSLFLKWQPGSSETDGITPFISSSSSSSHDTVSVNRVDHDGNTPLHYASKNGLLQCILLLTAHNAIISIVNKDQMTCCEIASMNEHHELADMLEIALIFPPLDQDVVLYDDEEERRYHQQIGGGVTSQPIFLCDTETYSFDSLDDWRKNGIECVVAALGLPQSYAELVLDHFNWEIEKTLEEMLTHQSEVLNLLNLNLQEFKPPLSYVLLTPSALPSHDVTDLDEIFVDVGKSSDLLTSLEHHHESQQQQQQVTDPSQRIIHITDRDVSIGNCSICGEDLYPTLSPHSLLNPSLPFSEQREIVCPAGHSYCRTCWAHHWSIQINDNGATFLPCMSFKCGEIISTDEWAIPVLGQALTEKLKTNLLRRIVDVSSRWKWCPAKDCDSIIHLTHLSVDNLIASPLSVGLKTPTSTPPETILPQSVICGNGHSFCLNCSGDSHAPCSCEHWKAWMEKIQREISETEGEKSGLSLSLPPSLSCLCVLLLLMLLSRGWCGGCRQCLVGCSKHQEMSTLSDTNREERRMQSHDLSQMSI